MTFLVVSKILFAKSELYSKFICIFEEFISGWLKHRGITGKRLRNYMGAADFTSSSFQQDGDLLTSLHVLSSIYLSVLFLLFVFLFILQ